MDSKATTKPGDQNGIAISSSQVRRLEREVKNLKEEYDSLKIKTLCMTDEEKKDQAKFKTDSSKLESLRKQISSKEKLIIEIKLALKWAAIRR